jgi:NAD(P)-dependent dehydrogenase (short-subunit alcohol dehydrogenase family)
MAGPYFDTSSYDLSGKYAVVTGGNSGIGQETVLELIRLNCNVIIGARDRLNSEKVVKMAHKIISEKK